MDDFHEDDGGLYGRVELSSEALAAEYTELLRKFRSLETQYKKAFGALGIPYHFMERLDRDLDIDNYHAVYGPFQVSPPGQVKQPYIVVLEDAWLPARTKRHTREWQAVVERRISLRRLFQRAGTILPSSLRHPESPDEPFAQIDTWGLFVFANWDHRRQPPPLWIRAGNDNAAWLKDRIGLRMKRGETFQVLRIPSLYRLSADAIETFRLAPLAERIEPLGDRRYRIGRHPPIELAPREDRVLEVLRKNPGIGKDALCRKSGIGEDAPRVLKALMERYDGRFAVAIHLPGARNRGGYHVDFCEPSPETPT